MFPDDMNDTNDAFDRMMRDADLDDRLARLSARADRTRPAAGAAPKGATPKRRSAAKGSRRAALGLSAVSTLGLAGWMYSAAGAATTNTASIAATTDPTAAASTTPTTAAAATTSSTAKATTSTTVAASGSTSSTGLADGTYTGSSVSTRFGAVQVQITVSGGKITAVTVPAYPRNDNKSAQINATAVPKLVSATLTAQSANVSNVSGATYTTNGYKTSLQSAIDAAKKGA